MEIKGTVIKLWWHTGLITRAGAKVRFGGWFGADVGSIVGGGLDWVQ